MPICAPERRTYAAMISALDDGVGLVLRTLRELHLDDNTLVLFTADNGATREARAGLDGKPATAGNNAPFRGNKFSAFDGGMHVPMIMNWPGVIPKGEGGSRSGQPSGSAAHHRQGGGSRRRPRIARWMAATRSRWPPRTRPRRTTPSSGRAAGNSRCAAESGNW